MARVAARGRASVGAQARSEETLTEHAVHQLEDVKRRPEMGRGRRVGATPGRIGAGHSISTGEPEVYA